MNDVDFPVQRVLDGIDAAAAAGLPVKVNAVVKRGANDDDVRRARGALPRQRPRPPLHRVHGRRLDERLAARGRRQRRGDRASASASAGRSSRSTPRAPDATARRWRYVDGAGEIGVVASVTQPFCGGCSRARLSAEGRLYTCLFAARGHDLRAPLRLGASDEELAETAPRHLVAPNRPLLGAAHGGNGRAAQGRDVLHRRLVTGASDRAD